MQLNFKEWMIDEAEKRTLKQKIGKALAPTAIGLGLMAGAKWAALAPDYIRGQTPGSWAANILPSEYPSHYRQSFGSWKKSELSPEQATKIQNASGEDKKELQIQAAKEWARNKYPNHADFYVTTPKEYLRKQYGRRWAEIIKKAKARPSNAPWGIDMSRLNVPMLMIKVADGGIQTGEDETMERDTMGMCHKLSGGDGVAVCPIAASGWEQRKPKSGAGAFTSEEGSWAREELRHAMQRSKGGIQIYQVVSPKVLSTKNPYYKKLVKQDGKEVAESRLEFFKYISRGVEFYAKLSELKAWASKGTLNSDATSLDADIDELIQFYNANKKYAPGNAKNIIELIEKWAKAYPKEHKELKKKANDMLPSLVTTQEPETDTA